MNDVVGKVADLVSELRSLVDNEQSMAVIINKMHCEVLMPFPKDFLAYFKEYDINGRNGGMTFELACEIEGVRFKTFVTEQEYLELTGTKA